MRALPIFPLGTVLMPGGRLPLRIFEPRYVSLLRDLLDTPDREPQFGVLAIRSGTEVGPGRATDLYGIGCLARVYQVNAVADGSFKVFTWGAQRFSLDAIDDSAGTPYLTGRVTWLDEPPGDPSLLHLQAARVRDLLVRYRALTSVATSTPTSALPSAENADPPDEAEELSYRLADLVTLTKADRQALLACPDTESRLRLGGQLLRRELILVATLSALPPSGDLGSPATSN